MPASRGMSAAELAGIIEGTVEGDPGLMVQSCAPLEDATAEQVSFLSNQKYARDLNTTKAGVVILSASVKAGVKREEGLPPLTTIVAKDPYFAWQKAVVALHGYRVHEQVSEGVSPLARVHASARIGAGAQVHAFASIGENVRIGAGATIYPHVAVMKDVVIGEQVTLYPNVTIYDGCVLGNRVTIHSGSVVGSDGYGYATAQGAHHKIPHIGNVVIGDDVEIGANTVIERAVTKSTVIGKGSKLGNTVVIGHNVEVGEYNLLVSQVGIAGSTTTGKYVVMAGQVGVAGHLSIADMTRIAAQSGVMQDITTPNMDHGGSPAMEAKHARRVYLQFVQLPELAKRVSELEKMLKERLKAEG